MQHARHPACKCRPPASPAMRSIRPHATPWRAPWCRPISWYNPLSRLRINLLLTALLLASCGGGQTGSTPTPAPDAANLSTADVEQVIAQAVQEAGARGMPATIAVVDRSGNVLAVFQMHDTVDPIRVDSGRGVVGGLEGISVVPAALGAISQAITGAYL